MIPEEISCDDQIFDISFHPQTDILSAGLINGSIDIWKYNSDNTPQLVLKTNHHSSSCRGLEFNRVGDILYSISSDKSLQGIDCDGKQVLIYSQAHSSPINKFITVNDNIIGMTLLLL